MLKYLLAQDMEQNLLVPLNWLAGAKFLQYSHFSTEGKVWRRNRADGERLISTYDKVTSEETSKLAQTPFKILFLILHQETSRDNRRLLYFTVLLCCFPFKFPFHSCN